MYTYKADNNFFSFKSAYPTLFSILW